METWHECTAHLAMEDCTGQRVIGDQVGDKIDGSAEALAKSWRSRLIPGLDTMDLIVGPPAEYDGAAQRARSREARTSAQGLSSSG